MPRLCRPATLSSLLLTACTPARFGAEAAHAAQLRAYRESFAAAAGGAFVATCPRQRFCEMVAAAPALWLGDHHRDSRLHALHSRLLDDLQQQGVRLALGLEAIGTADQADVDAFLAGAIPMSTLRDRMRDRWSGSWLDDRELDPWYYRSLLTFAQKHRLPVFALEPTPRLPLAERDDRMASAIAAAARRLPDRIPVIVVGQSHLLGSGDLVGRAGLGGIVVGGRPTAALRATAPGGGGRDELWRSDAGLWWFAEMLADDAAGAALSR